MLCINVRWKTNLCAKVLIFQGANPLFNVGSLSNLFDKEDVILESTQDSVENWKPGTKARFEFFTSEKFNKYAVEQAEWSISEE